MNIRVMKVNHSFKQSISDNKPLYNKIKLCGNLAKYVYYTDQSALICENKKEIIIALRGTTNAIDWLNNVSIIRKKNDIHRGFYKHSMDCIRKNKILHLVKQNNKPITICAHSLGAAAATILLFQLAQYFENRECCLIMFGSPMPGGEQFAANFAKKLPHLKIYNIQNIKDIVCLLPLNLLGYTHIHSSEYIFDTNYHYLNLLQNHTINTYINEVENIQTKF
jgi:predicted lipase